MAPQHRHRLAALDVVDRGVLGPHLRGRHDIDGLPARSHIRGFEQHFTVGERDLVLVPNADAEQVGQPVLSEKLGCERQLLVEVGPTVDVLEMRSVGQNGSHTTAPFGSE